MVIIDERLSPLRPLLTFKCMFLMCLQLWEAFNTPSCVYFYQIFLKNFTIRGKGTRKAQLKNYYHTLYSSITFLALPFSLKVRNIQYTYELTLGFFKTWGQHYFPSCFLHKNLTIWNSVISWFVYIVVPLFPQKYTRKTIINSGHK